MISSFSKNTDSGVCGFVADTASEINGGVLPTTTTAGTGELVNVPKVPMGSWCIAIDTADVYMLTSEDAWVKL